MNIRPVAPNDLMAWAQMRNELWPDSLNQHQQELEAFFLGKQFDIDYAYVLELDNAELAGFIEINIRDYAEGATSSPIPYLEAWYVSDGHRHLGYGQSLIRFFEQWSKNKGFKEIASDTTLDNQRSIDLHKRLGFEETERVVCFVKKL